MNPYNEYYMNQAGSGLTGFSGTRYQRGHGFFGKLFSGALLPALKFLGRQALNTGVNVGQDFLEGKNFKQSMKERAIESGKVSANAAINRAKKFAQTGKGRKRKRVTKKTKAKRIKSIFD